MVWCTSVCIISSNKVWILLAFSSEVHHVPWHAHSPLRGRFAFGGTGREWEKVYELVGLLQYVFPNGPLTLSVSSPAVRDILSR